MSERNAGAGRSVALLALVSMCGCSGEPPDERPDILFVSIDSLRPDHLGCYGYHRDTSPTLDRLAQEGARFNQAVATTSWTLPSHAAMFTGLYDSAHGLVDNGLRLSDDHVTLAELLRESGYRTAGFFGGPYLHPTFGLAQGFEHYQSCMTTVADDVTDDAIRSESRADIGASHHDVNGPRTVAEFERWLTGVPDGPLFAFVHLWDVHYDYIPPPEYAALFDADYDGDLSVRGFMHNPAIRREMPARDLEHVMALYDAEIRFTDDTLAAILAALEARDRLDDTLIVVTSDHGEEFFEHGYKGHARTLFDEVLRVPLIVRWPRRVAAGTVVDTQVRTIDLMPTLLTVAGVTSRPAMQGRDITPLLFGGRLPEETALAELLLDGQSMRASRTPRYKVVVPRAGLAPVGFDLVRDPAELEGLARHSPELFAGMRELTRQVEAAEAFRERIAARTRDLELDEETLRRLEALGYVDGGSTPGPDGER